MQIATLHPDRHGGIRLDFQFRHLPNRLNQVVELLRRRPSFRCVRSLWIQFRWHQTWARLLSRPFRWNLRRFASLVLLGLLICAMSISLTAQHFGCSLESISIFLYSINSTLLKFVSCQNHRMGNTKESGFNYLKLIPEKLTKQLAENYS